MPAIPATVRAGTGGRALRPLLPVLSLLAVIAVWAALVRPESLGGATGYVMVSGRSMEPLLHDGDLVLTRKRTSYRRGDVIAYRVPEGDVGTGAMVIHRVVGGSATTGYVTLGDNRDTEDLWRPKDEDVIGSMVLHLPRAGSAMAMVRGPLPMAILAALFVLFSFPQRRKSDGPR